MAQNINPSAMINPSASSTKTNDEERSSAQDNHAVAKRLQKELMHLMMSGEKGISAFPEGENLFKWIATITGPAGTVFEGFSFRLSVVFPNGYPYSPPSIRMITPCYHPNVDTAGNICLDILKEKWTALYDVTTILLSLQSLLAEPNNDSPLNAQAAALWDDQVAYRKYLLDNYKQT